MVTGGPSQAEMGEQRGGAVFRFPPSSQVNPHSSHTFQSQIQETEKSLLILSNSHPPKSGGTFQTNYSL